MLVLRLYGATASDMKEWTATPCPQCLVRAAFMHISHSSMLFVCPVSHVVTMVLLITPKLGFGFCALTTRRCPHVLQHEPNHLTWNQTVPTCRHLSHEDTANVQIHHVPLPPSLSTVLPALSFSILPACRGRISTTLITCRMTMRCRVGLALGTINDNIRTGLKIAFIPALEEEQIFSIYFWNECAVEVRLSHTSLRTIRERKNSRVYVFERVVTLVLYSVLITTMHMHST